MQRTIRHLFSPVLLVLAPLLVVFTGCDSSGDNGPEALDATGTVSGQLVDKVTNDPLPGAAVVLKSVQGEDGTPRRDTTGADGAFFFEDVPVNRSSESGTPSSQHVLELDLSGVSGPYRDRYSAEVSLPYGQSGEGESANNLTASVTIPISRLNAEISGALMDTDGDPLSNTKVVLVQRLPLSFDAGGDPDDFSDVLVDSVRTGSDGGYTFSGAEASSEAFLQFRMNGHTIGRDPSRDYFSIPTGNGPVAVDRGEVEATPPSFEVTLVEPERGVDVGQNSTSFVFRFTAPVAQSPFTTTDEAFGNGSMRDFFEIERTGAKVRPTGDLELDLSFNSDRTELTVSTADPLQDGSRYEFNAAAFDDSRFENVYGQSLANGGDFAGADAIDFTVGIDESTPPTPTFEFTTDDGTQPTKSGTPFDYGDDFTVLFRVQAPSSGPDLKGYEVFIKSGDDSFEPVDVATFNQFEFDGSGRVEFRAPFQNSGDDVLNNFVGSNGGYNEKQLKVRAVSINNVRSDFSNTLTIADQNPPNLTSATYEDSDDDGEDELVARFNEPVDPASLAADVFTIVRDGSELSGVIQSAERPPVTGEEVELEVSDSYTPNDGASNDELRADGGGTTDLAGNSVDTNANLVNIP